MTYPALSAHCRARRRRGQCFSLSTWMKMNGAKQSDPIALGWENAEVHFPPCLSPALKILFCVSSAGPFLRSCPAQLPSAL